MWVVVALALAELFTVNRGRKRNMAQQRDHLRLRAKTS